jgi:hypothetical protein
LWYKARCPKLHGIDRQGHYPGGGGQACGLPLRYLDSSPLNTEDKYISFERSNGKSNEKSNEKSDGGVL